MSRTVQTAMRCLTILVAFQCTQAFGQTIVQQFEGIATRMRDLKTAAVTGADSLSAANFSKLMSTMTGQLGAQKALNASGSFGFSGNETERSNLFKVSAGVAFDHGSYPYQFDFLTSIETVLKNGEFEENVADIDISFDLHPISPKLGGEGIGFENFVFLSRFSDDYLGIEQTYEAGAGILLTNITKPLTQSGESTKRSLNEPLDVITNYYDASKRVTALPTLSVADSVTVSKMRARLTSANRKIKTKLRYGVLIGVYYELEKANATNTLALSTGDSLVSMSFPATNRFRWEFRPTFRWQPADGFKFKIYPYLKMPMPWDWTNTVSGPNGSVDERIDWFLDLQASWTAAITKHFGIAIRYRLLYVNAPRRTYFLDQGSPLLLMGAQAHHGYSLALKFNL